jgi:hypothetical protein
VLSLKKKFLFIHIPKTAGNAIQGHLRDYSEDEITAPGPLQDGIERFELRSSLHPRLHKHSTLCQYRRVLPRGTLDEIFTFACIRNPWDRMVSLYFSPHRQVSTWDRAAFIELIRATPTTYSYVDARGWSRRWMGSRFQPDPPSVDFLMRFESLQEDFRRVCQRLGVPCASLPIRNKSNREHYSVYYDEETIEMVGRKFRYEIRLANYRFDSSPPAAASASPILADEHPHAAGR